MVSFRPNPVTKACPEWHWVKVEILERLRLNHYRNLMVST